MISIGDMVSSSFVVFTLNVLQDATTASTSIVVVDVEVVVDNAVVDVVVGRSFILESRYFSFHNTWNGSRDGQLLKVIHCLIKKDRRR